MAVPYTSAPGQEGNEGLKSKLYFSAPPYTLEWCASSWRRLFLILLPRPCTLTQASQSRCFILICTKAASPQKQGVLAITLWSPSSKATFPFLCDAGQETLQTTSPLCLLLSVKRTMGSRRQKEAVDLSCWLPITPAVSFHPAAMADSSSPPS